MSVLYFVAATVVALAAFLRIAGPLSNMIFFIVFWFVNAGFVLVYLASQVILVLIALDDRWSLGKPTKERKRRREIETTVF